MSRRRETASSVERSRRVRLGRVEVEAVDEEEVREDMPSEVHATWSVHPGRPIAGAGDRGARNAAAGEEAAKAARRAERR